jgi:hypothetical protein
VALPTAAAGGEHLPSNKGKAVLWIRIGFNADPDSAFYLNTDPDPRS